MASMVKTACLTVVVILFIACMKVSALPYEADGFDDDQNDAQMSLRALVDALVGKRVYCSCASR